MFFRPGLTKGLPRGGYYSTHTARVLRVKTRNEGGVECVVVVCTGLGWLCPAPASWEAGGVRDEGRVAGCGPRPSGLPRACPQGCPMTRSYPFKFGGAGGKHRTKRRLHPTDATPTAGCLGDVEVEPGGAGGGALRFFADMLRSRSEEGAALRYTAGDA